MISPVVFHGTALSSVFLLGLFVGYSCSSDKYFREQQEIAYQQMETQQLLLDDKYRTESQLHEDIQNAQTVYNLDTQKVYKDYDALVFNPVFDDIDWLSDSNSAQSDERMSDSSNDSERAAAKTECRCPKDYAGELQRIRTLYEKELVKAKECDLKTVQLNSLIDIVEKMQKQ